MKPGFIIIFLSQQYITGVERKEEMKMKFTFEKIEHNPKQWRKENEWLMQQLIAVSTSDMPANEAAEYVKDVLGYIEEYKNPRKEVMHFLMYDYPNTMPSDARVLYVYKPTYIITSILMTLAYRHEEVREIEGFDDMLRSLMTSCIGRKFLGSGYDQYDGFLEAMRIFATGDAVLFVQKYPEYNEKFTDQLDEALLFLEMDLCTGEARDGFYSNNDRSEEANEVMALFNRKLNQQKEYVWYACYGSNICRQRFMEYINRCDDNTPPVEDRPYEFDYDMYFAKKACIWDDGGKAFLDLSKPGHAYGRIYKVTKEQYEQIRMNEGSDYSYHVDLGMLDGIPVYTFTDTKTDNDRRLPSYRYYNVILQGLRECYEGILDGQKITQYLNHTVMCEEAYQIGKAVRENRHVMTTGELMERTGYDVDTVIDSIKWLVENGMLKQDGRSTQRITDLDAFFYTIDSPCARALINAMMEAEGIQ